MLKQLWDIREMVRAKPPQVYTIINHAAAEFTANVLLAAGAKPLMSEGAAEADDLAKAADVLVINIGTLHTSQISCCLKAGERANLYGKPVVFDPAGAGTTAYRSMTAFQILKDVRIGLIRASYAETAFLVGIEEKIRGSGEVQRFSEDLVRSLCQQSEALVAATGPVNYISDSETTLTVSAGHNLQQAIIASDCALSALTGAFLSVADDRKLAVLAALAFYGAAAEKAGKNSKGPGSFANKFLDVIYNMNFKEFKKAVDGKIEWGGAYAPLIVEQNNLAGGEIADVAQLQLSIDEEVVSEDGIDTDAPR